MSKVNIFKVRVFSEVVYDRNNHYGFIHMYTKIQNHRHFWADIVTGRNHILKKEI